MTFFQSNQKQTNGLTDGYTDGEMEALTQNGQVKVFPPNNNHIKNIQYYRIYSDSRPEQTV